jgi:RND family efflux transporter MFP subunit
MRHTIIFIFTLFISCGGGETKKPNLKELIKQRSELDKQIRQLEQSLTSDEQSFSLVNLNTIKYENFKHFVEVQGTVDTRKNILINSELPGIIKKILVNKGEYVTKGKLLAIIDDRTLQENLKRFEIELQLLEKLYDKQKRLWEQKIGSEIDYLQAKTKYDLSLQGIEELKTQIGKTKILAPFNGYIDDIISETGQLVNPGVNPIFRLINLKDMYVRAEVPENYINTVRQDVTTEIYFPFLDKNVKSQVRQVGNYINPNNRSFTIEVDINNDNKQVKPNLTAKIRINDYTNKKAIVVPSNIILEDSRGKKFVFIAQPTENPNNYKAIRTYIQTGKIQGINTEVTNGLSLGHKVIVEGFQGLDNNQTVISNNN